MSSVFHFIIAILLFIILTPGVFFRFPRKGTLINAAVVHGILFAIINYLLYFGIHQMSEGFLEGAAVKVAATTAPPFSVPIDLLRKQNPVSVSNIESFTRENLDSPICSIIEEAKLLQSDFDSSVKRTLPITTAHIKDSPFSQTEKIALGSYIIGFQDILTKLQGNDYLGDTKKNPKGITVDGIIINPISGILNSGAPTGSNNINLDKVVEKYVFYKDNQSALKGFLIDSVANKKGLQHYISATGNDPCNLKPKPK